MWTRALVAAVFLSGCASPVVRAVIHACRPTASAQAPSSGATSGRRRTAAASTTSRRSPTTRRSSSWRTASGGIFKTVNNGVTWTPVFDEDGGSLSIGDIAIAPSDRNVVWAGTGEPNNRQSSSWGDGVYKSLDGGETWTPHGAARTRTTSAASSSIRPIPTSSTSPRSATCGGRTTNAGCSRPSTAARPGARCCSSTPTPASSTSRSTADGRTLFAAAYQRRRRAWGFVGGGPGGGLLPLARRRRDVAAARQRAAGRHRRPHRRRDRARAIRTSSTRSSSTRRGGVYRSDDRGATLDAA